MNEENKATGRWEKWSPLEEGTPGKAGTFGRSDTPCSRGKAERGSQNTTFRKGLPGGEPGSKRKEGQTFRNVNRLQERKGRKKCGKKAKGPRENR